MIDDMIHKDGWPSLFRGGRTIWSESDLRTRSEADLIAAKAVLDTILFEQNRQNCNLPHEREKP